MSLRLRLLAAFAYVLVLVLVALAIPLALNVSRRVDAEVKAHSSGEAYLVAATATGSLDDLPALQKLAVESGRTLAGRVIVVDADGSVLADSAGAGSTAENYASRPEIRTALDDGQAAQGTRRSDTLDQEILYTAVPIVVDGRRVGAVRVTQSVDAIQDKVGRDILALAAIAAAALVLGLALAWLLAGTLSRPLRGLARTARQVAAGDLDARAEITGSTEQRDVAQAFNDMTARLGASMEAQREFVANASHQLRTPLTGLRLRLEAAAIEADEPALRQELEAAEREADRLARLLAGLLTLARADERAAPRQEVDLGRATTRAEERWEAAAAARDQRIELGTLPPARAWTSDDDVAIILDNLIENALVYSPPGGAVTIDCGVQGDVAFLAVLDDGPGFDSGEVGRVLQRFTRGRAGRSSPGTGLGLAIVRTLAERSAGRVTIENRKPRGARVQVTFPRAGRDSLPPLNPELEESLSGSA